MVCLALELLPISELCSPGRLRWGCFLLWFSLVPFGPGERLGLLQRLVARQDLWLQPSGRQVVPVEELLFPAIGKAHFKAAAPRHGFMFDDANTGWHFRKPHRLMDSRRNGLAGFLNPDATV